MRGITKYIAALGILCCTGIKPMRAQIMIPEELQAANNNITLLQSAGNKLWAIQLISESSGIFTYSLSGKQNGVWKRLPPFKVVAQNGLKTPEFSDIEVFHDRIYLSGNFIEVNSKNNCLIYFDLVKQVWEAPLAFTAQSGFPVILSLALADNSLFIGGTFLQVGSLKYNNLAKITKDLNLSQVKIKTFIGASSTVVGIESDSTQKTIYLSGYFRNILGKVSSGFNQYRVADSTFLQTPIPWGTNVVKMRVFGSKLVCMTEDSATKERNIFFLTSGANLVRASGIDTLYSVVNFFSNKGIIYFTGDAQPEFDDRSYGIFRISESSKTERVYRQFFKIFRAEGFEGNIYVHGYFVRFFSNGSVADNFNLARIDDGFKRFYGRVFHDNGDGKYNALQDKLVGGHNVAIFANGSFQFMIPTEKNGYFTFIVPAKNAIVFKAIVEKTVELKTVSNYMFRADTFNERVVDFPVQYLTNSYSNVRVRVTAATGWQLRKDTSELYVIKVMNTGLVPAQPDIVLDIDGKIRGIQTDPAPFQIDPGTHTKLTWKLNQAIQPGGESTFMIKLTAPSTEFADQEQIDFNASVANFTDNNPADNVDTLQQTVTSSVNANAKFQYPEIPNGEAFAWLDPDAGKIEYIIRFTNVSSDTVVNVVVRDTIATPDYVTYIQETGSSHPFTRLVYTTPYLPNKVIVAYTFSNVKLPPNPSGNMELVNSSGYIGFRLGLKSQLVSGTDLSNRASIYLDNEEPILTATVVARVATSSIVKAPGHKTKLIYPNPFDEKLYFESVEAGEVFELYNMQGQQLVSTNIQGNSVDLEAYGLASGMYIWSTRNRLGEVFTGKISKK